ncbi:MAG TPA: AbrB/MazE/SpoVT family DNA-binding domain-containing protein [Caulobacteraceae bacterium]|nr:AbrB/MazE/SpoVT family DNA-binding domain-containing protein [Caulobacteraceae bacterium]
MKVARWGNSLAVRIPAEVANAVGLKEGDEVQMHVAETGRAFEVKKQMTRQEALEGLRKLRGLIPADIQFDREEANSR